MIEKLPVRPVHVPAYVRDVADALLAAEVSSDAMLSGAAQLINAAASGRSGAGINARAAQPILDELEHMIVSQFASRRAMMAAHTKLHKLGGQIVGSGDDGMPWGPTEDCKFASKAHPETAAAVAA